MKSSALFAGLYSNRLSKAVTMARELQGSYNDNEVRMSNDSKFDLQPYHYCWVGSKSLHVSAVFGYVNSKVCVINFSIFLLF